MKKLLRVSLLAVLTLWGCTNKAGENESPVTMTVTLPLQPLIIQVSTGLPVQIQTITLTSHLKNPNATDPQHFADVQVSYYQVKWLRHDGGTRLPKLQQFAAAVVVPSGGSTSLTNFPILAGADLLLSPFDQLLPFNGGVDQETGLTEIHLFYELTFFGQTVSGQRVQSETATGDLFFR